MIFRRKISRPSRCGSNPSIWRRGQRQHGRGSSSSLPKRQRGHGCFCPST
ncbi:unnamed protein product [Spirodela intermedia]|uniref:Uncharacterized protein n=1 Tax=Spirodela intermedia TaxID=51605 RepID=A0ABN7EBR1_SPIIN|nr:unnamed protein product [Spirodela intermedia]